MGYKLLLDSSDQNLSVGVAKDDNLVYRTSFYAWQRQSEYMIPEIEKAIKELHLEMRDFDLIAVGIGPGSYTGIRIPLAIAKTLNTLFGTKIVAISSLKIMGTKEEKYIAVMNARSRRSYVGIYENGSTILKDQVVENDRLLKIIEEYLAKGFVLKGSLDYLNLDFVSTNDVILGLLSYSNDQAITNAASLCPIYLKD